MVSSNITCKSSWAIYIVKCSQCNKQYTHHSITLDLKAETSTRHNTNYSKCSPLQSTVPLSGQIQNNRDRTHQQQITRNNPTQRVIWILKLKTLHPHDIDVYE